jgi:hypothetical protein
METLDFGAWSLLVAAFSMTAIASIGIYQSLFVHPLWFKDPPASLQSFKEDKSVALWVPLQLVALIALIASVTTHNGPVNNYIWFAIGCYALTWVVTFIFFIPGVIAFRKIDTTGSPSAELKVKGQKWLRRSSIRLVLLLAGSLALLIALAK